MSTAVEHVRALLNPASLAVVGASEASPWSQGFMRNLRSFRGEVHLVNPRRDTAFGRKTFPTLRDIDGPVDHAVLLVGASRVPDVLRDAAAAGIRCATVIASGFGEGGGEGDDLAREVDRICAEHGIAALGPNCYGFNNYSGTYVSRYNIDVPSQPGSIGLSFQSGQLGGATADAASARGIHLRYVVSSGNELIVDTNDLLEFFLESDDIAVAGGVLERIPDPERFERLARRALDLGKPIVVLKPGRSAAASRIAVAHTGAITGTDEVVQAFFDDLGVIRVGSVEELAETAGLLARRGCPSGNRTAFVGFSGGACELFAEQADGTSIELQPHSSRTLAELSEVSTLPAEVIHNPFDMTVDGAAHYAEIVETLGASGDFDVIVSQGQPKRFFEAPLGPGETDPSMAARATRSKALTGAAERHGVFTTFLDTSDHQPSIGVFEQEPPNGSYYALGNNGVTAISNVIRYGGSRARILNRRSPARYDVDASWLADFAGRAGPLNEADSKALLEGYGIAVTEDIVTRSPAEAAAAADKIGYPVVLKVVAANVAHKSDVGGVVLGLTNGDEVCRAYDSTIESVTRAVKNADIEGVLVTRQVAEGAEFIAGITTDVALGPVVVAGLGGVYVEVFKDVVLLRPPFSKEEAMAALGSLRSAPILHGTRGGAALDVQAFGDVLSRLGQLAGDLGDELVELDVNPLFVYPAGQGVLAADALVVLR